jgi:hypothetical protein
MTKAYGYLAGLIVVVTLITGAFFYGRSVGEQAGKLALTETVAKLNQVAARQLQAAIIQQQAEDQARIAAADNAVQAATAAKTAADTNLKALTVKLQEMSDVPQDKAWMDTVIPADVRGLLNGATGSGQSRHR